MTTIIGVRFRGSGKIYYFDPAGLPLVSGTEVIVETARGIEMGTCAGPVRDVSDDQVTLPLKKVIRAATDEDILHVQENRRKEKEAMEICREKIEKHGLDMKLIDAEYTFDRNKILFYFTSEGRVDFRELVKDLASVFRTRIELRQIGVRDETKILGGIGICGRPLCCSTWLTDFVPVSIKMAKEQNLSLNPTKISGVCGRLMCCLKNEQETYEYLNNQLPAMGETVYTDTGLKGEVAGVNVLRQRVKVLVEVDDEKEIHELDVSELHFKPKRRRDKKDGDKKDGEKKDGEKKDTEKKNTDRKDGGKKDGDRKDGRKADAGDRDGEEASRPKEGTGKNRNNKDRRKKQAKEQRSGTAEQAGEAAGRPDNDRPDPS